MAVAPKGSQVTIGHGYLETLSRLGWKVSIVGARFDRLRVEVVSPAGAAYSARSHSVEHAAGVIAAQVLGLDRR